MGSHDRQTGCVFCQQDRKGYLTIGKRNIKNCILWETPNFLVWPSVGPLVEGHLLIVPKNHYLSMAELPEELCRELENLIADVRRLFNKKNGKVIFFEHGSAPECLSKKANSIDHAHLHALPLDFDLSKVLREKFGSAEVTTIKELKTIFKGIKPYIYFESAEGRRFCYDISNECESQCVRKILAENIGRKRYWDWRVYPGTKVFLKTLQNLRCADFK